MALGPEVIKKAHCSLTVAHVERLIDDAIMKYGNDGFTNKGLPAYPQLEFIINATCDHLDRKEIIQRYLDAGWDYVNLVPGNGLSAHEDRKMTVRIGKNQPTTTEEQFDVSWPLDKDVSASKFKGSGGHPSLGG